MKEAAFVKQNMRRWKEFESVAANASNANPDQLADLFIQVTDDLSFSRTQYPKSETTQYLNNLASKLHLSIYRSKQEDGKRIVYFWKTELPLLMYEVRKPLLYSFLTFAIAICLGIISTLNDETFVRLILGDGYVNMTLENIENGNPLAVYGDMNEADMFFAITFNNVRVSFMAFAAGLATALGSGWILFQNGIMVGAFFTFLAQEGFILNAFLVIMLHGTLELSAIVIAASAGFVMGNSFIFPGTYTRLESFKNGAKKGLKIIIGLIPIFITAGFIESFFTRYTQMPWIISLLTILLSATFIVYYFVIYPAKIFKNATRKLT
ncbi:stage II sporulation protein M [Fulvivirga sedimenti]|uniref:Stage II sporulation protein M n=1 Tax=Fulvivirga sedimenti TaxID=2879465 RepID=A0A9X1KWW1_9BACT|nr:stage II sporulation protein M [Fulvivirga sedimenti]MCA6074359.1 stage II sporulation protein M [Fulvivirga sedimenti]